MYLGFVNFQITGIKGISVLGVGIKGFFHSSRFCTLGEVLTWMLPFLIETSSSVKLDFMFYMT